MNSLTTFKTELQNRLGNGGSLHYSLISCNNKGGLYGSPITITPKWLAKKQYEELLAERKRRGTAEPVDLGLSVKWASHNLGAPCQEQPGYYVGWGDATCQQQSTYYDDYPQRRNIGGTIYDAARQMWGETWRIPTIQEMQELMQHCQWQWTQINGVTGFWITGSTGNSIFLPAGGDRYGCQYEDAYYFGRYWCDQIDEHDNARAYLLEFSQTSGNLFSLARYMGLLIRPVLAKPDTDAFKELRKLWEL